MKQLILCLLLMPMIVNGFDFADDRWDTNDKGYHYFGSMAMTQICRDFEMSRKASIFTVAFLGVCKEFADGSGVFPDNSLLGSTERKASWKDMTANIAGSVTSIVISDVVIPTIKTHILGKKKKEKKIPNELRLSFIQIEN